MTSAEFEAYVREMPRIKALRALEAAEVLMIPHISQSSRKEWFRALNKVLRPTFSSKNGITFNGREVNFKQLKRVFSSAVDKIKVG